MFDKLMAMLGGAGGMMGGMGGAAGGAGGAAGAAGSIGGGQADLMKKLMGGQEGATGEQNPMQSLMGGKQQAPAAPKEEDLAAATSAAAAPWMSQMPQMATEQSDPLADMDQRTQALQMLKNKYLKPQG